MAYIIVGISAIIGALLRYWIGLAVGQWQHPNFPVATLMINLIGSFALAWLTTFVFKRNLIHSHLAAGLGTGLIGAFTTFSTFSVETVNLIHASRWGAAILYVMLSLWGGLAMSYLGFRLGSRIYGKNQSEGGSLK
ncbi:fluoride efflux transporter CrcB [Heyndrickxia acidicola]|uniref:Fluoride-specific ion channel FluC n=1 Tax=Heyndrickxia acidicola TaxID=209389 RepID=A0ABU6MJ48_9BACI|nr:fluoride efflux transporter CrcB [Heyndrickxia acidicola]MED1204694.1 fluoride efflux transporter CrcB [Heyndrickxia acidicola]